MADNVQLWTREKQMQILVTGGAGYIGSHMVLALQESGYSPIVLDNLCTGFRDSIAPSVPFFEGNVNDTALVKSIIEKHNIRAIIHFAASVVVPESVTNPLKYYNNNTMSTCRIIETAVQCGIKSFIFSSTAAVYGTPAHNPVDEHASLMPESPYGTSKMMSEMILKDVCAASSMKYGILRYFNVAGADPQLRVGQRTKNATHLLKVASEAATGQRHYIDVYGTDYDTPDGTGVRDYIHVSDLVGAHLVVLKQLEKHGKSLTVNCGYGQGFSVLDVIKTVQHVSKNSTFDVRHCPRREGDMAQIIACADKLKSLGWKYKYNDLEEIAKTAVEWERRVLAM